MFAGRNQVVAFQIFLPESRFELLKTWIPELLKNMNLPRSYLHLVDFFVVNVVVILVTCLLGDSIRDLFIPQTLEVANT